MYLVTTPQGMEYVTSEANPTTHTKYFKFADSKDPNTPTALDEHNPNFSRSWTENKSSIESLATEINAYLSDELKVSLLF